MRIVFALVVLIFFLPVFAQSAPQTGKAFDRIAPKVKRAASSYSKATMARDRRAFSKAYPKVAAGLSKRGHPKSDTERALEASLVKFRAKNPNAPLTTNFFTKRTLELIKAVIPSSPNGASVEIFNISRGKADTGTTDTSLWLEAGTYAIEIAKDGYCSWKKEIVLSPDETPVQFEVLLQPSGSEDSCLYD